MRYAIITLILALVIVLLGIAGSLSAIVYVVEWPLSSNNFWFAVIVGSTTGAFCAGTAASVAADKGVLRIFTFIGIGGGGVIVASVLFWAWCRFVASV